MSDTKWTKGNWIVRDDFTISTEEGFEILWAKSTVKHQERVANAALAATAPDLYAALKMFACKCGNYRCAQHGDEGFAWDTCERRAARAALAKARGEGE